MPTAKFKLAFYETQPAVQTQRFDKGTAVLAPLGAFRSAAPYLQHVARSVSDTTPTSTDSKPTWTNLLSLPNANKCELLWIYCWLAAHGKFMGGGGWWWCLKAVKKRNNGNS